MNMSDKNGTFGRATAQQILRTNERPSSEQAKSLALSRELNLYVIALEKKLNEKFGE